MKTQKALKKYNKSAKKLLKHLADNPDFSTKKQQSLLLKSLELSFEIQQQLLAHSKTDAKPMASEATLISEVNFHRPYKDKPCSKCPALHGDICKCAVKKHKELRRSLT